jgi:CBS domain-containing protein
LAEVADFLRAHPPFDALEEADLEAVAAAVEIESRPAGAAVFRAGAGPVDHIWVVRGGAVEIVHDERVLDLLGPGELLGHAAMLAGLPPGFEARASEATTLYRIPAAVARPLMSRPEGLRYMAREVLAGVVNARRPAVDPAQRRVATLIRSPPVRCPPDTEIREAARRMSAAGATAAVIPLDGAVGILTDRDLRERVLAGGLSADARVSEAMSAPAYTVPAERLGGEVLLEMLDRGFHHFPVLSPTGEVLGVVEAADLVAIEARTPFLLRAAIGRARSVDEVMAEAGRLPATVIELHDAQAPAVQVSAVWSVVVDALTRRLIELAVVEAGEPPAAISWLALGSLARREGAPSSDVDSALAWQGDGSEPAVRAYAGRIASTVTAGLRRCGLTIDEHGASAANPQFARSLASWEAAARGLLEDPTQDQALILVSVIVDGRPVWGVRAAAPLADAFREARRNPVLLRLLARYALQYRPPTGFLRGLVVEHSGEHRGRLDLKHGGLVPIVDLARWAGLAAGVTGASTRERLRAATAAGTLAAEDARTLREAFDLIWGLRLAHQVEQLRAGRRPDDHLDPRTLTPLTRSQLREAFRAVAAVQRGVGAELEFGLR